jgi:RNA polymerase sigma-70 factor (ECF subfamily)
MTLVRDEPTVDDLLQLTFLKAHLARDRFRLASGDPDGAVQGWYFAIARNVALDHLRQRGRREHRQVDWQVDATAEPGFADDAVSIEDMAIDREQAAEIVERVREAIANLPPGQREVVELHKLRGMSMAEVAARLDIREGAARVRAHRGYRALARMLGTSGAAAFALASTLRSSPARLTLDHVMQVLTLIGLDSGGPS